MRFCQLETGLHSCRTAASVALVVRDGVAVFLAPRGVPIWLDHESVNQIIGAPANTQLDERGTSEPG